MMTIEERCADIKQKLDAAHQKYPRSAELNALHESLRLGYVEHIKALMPHSAARSGGKEGQNPDDPGYGTPKDPE